MARLLLSQSLKSPAGNRHMEKYKICGKGEADACGNVSEEVTFARRPKS